MASEPDAQFTPSPVLPPGALAPVTPAAPASLRMAKRMVTLELPDPYQGFTFTAWMNFPGALFKDLNSRDEERTLGALTQIITDHNLVDFDGNPYPDAATREFWDAVPPDVMGAMIQTLLANVGKLPPPTAPR